MNSNPKSQNKWDCWSVYYDYWPFRVFRWFQKKALLELEIKPGNHFLDVGCGTGWAVNFISGKMKYQGYFTGIDSSEGMIKKAKQTLNGNKNVNFIKASSDNLPLANESHHYIICTNSFHHYQNPGKVLNEMYRVLKPGGALLILDVTRDNLFSGIFNLLLSKYEKDHVKFYSSDEYRSIFTSANFKYRQGPVYGLIFRIHLGIK